MAVCKRTFLVVREAGGLQSRNMALYNLSSYCLQPEHAQWYVFRAYENCSSAQNPVGKDQSLAFQAKTRF